MNPVTAFQRVRIEDWMSNAAIVKPVIQVLGIIVRRGLYNTICFVVLLHEEEWVQVNVTVKFDVGPVDMV